MYATKGIDKTDEWFTKRHNKYYNFAFDIFNFLKNIANMKRSSG